MRALLALALLASPALAQHRVVSVPTCTPEIIYILTPPPPPPPVGACLPTTTPGTACIWPSTATTVQLKDPNGKIARVVALVEGPPLIPLSPTAIRFGLTITVIESWIDCPVSPSAFLWRGDLSLLSDVVCPLP
jgi:hypothetical protein